MTCAPQEARGNHLYPLPLREGTAKDAALELSWVAPAIGSPVIYAAVSIGDKLILSRTGIRLGSFYFYVGASQLVTAAFVLAIEGLPVAPAEATLSAWGGGFLWGAGLTLMFWVLKREEVSRVTPVWQTSPIFVAVIAVAFLDEALMWRQWLAICLVVAGAAAVSLRRSRAGAGPTGFVLRPTFFVLLLGSLLIGIAQTLLKAAADDLSVWHSMAFRGIGLFTALSLPHARPQALREMGRFLWSPRTGAAIFFTETAAPFVGNLLLLTAIANGPVSLVSALLGSRPIFVLLLTLLLGLIAKGVMDDRMTRGDVAVKAASTGAVVGGVALIALG